MLSAGTGRYTGSISEQGGTVDLSPPLAATNGPICGYRIINKHKSKLPFQVKEIYICMYIITGKILRMTATRLSEKIFA